MASGGKRSLGGSYVKPTTQDQHHLTTTFASTQLQIRDTLKHALEAQRDLGQAHHAKLARIVSVQQAVTALQWELTGVDKRLEQQRRDLELWRRTHAAVVQELRDAISGSGMTLAEEPIMVEVPDESMYQSLPAVAIDTDEMPPSLLPLSSTLSPASSQPSPAVELGEVGHSSQPSPASSQPSPAVELGEVGHPQGESGGGGGAASSVVQFSMVMLPPQSLGGEEPCEEASQATTTSTPESTETEQQVQVLLLDNEEMTKNCELLVNENGQLQDVILSMEKGSLENYELLKSLQEENANLDTELMLLKQASVSAEEMAHAKMTSLGNVLATACNQSDAQLEQLRQEKEGLRESLFLSAKEKDSEIASLNDKLTVTEETLVADKQNAQALEKEQTAAITYHKKLVSKLQQQLDSSRKESLQRAADASQQLQIVQDSHTAMSQALESNTQKHEGIVVRLEQQEAETRRKNACLSRRLLEMEQLLAGKQRQQEGDDLARETLLSERKLMQQQTADLSQENETMLSRSVALQAQVQCLTDEASSHKRQLTSVTEAAALVQHEFDRRLRENEAAHAAVIQETHTARESFKAALDESFKATLDRAVAEGVEVRRGADRAAFQARHSELLEQAQHERQAAVQEAEGQAERSAALEVQLSLAQSRVADLENAMRSAALEVSRSLQELRTAQNSQQRYRTAFMGVASAVEPAMAEVSEALAPEELTVQVLQILESRRAAAGAAPSAPLAPQTPFTDNSFVLTTSGCDAGDYVVFTREAGTDVWSVLGERQCKLHEVHVQENLQGLDSLAFVAKVILRYRSPSGHILVNIEAPIWALDDM